MFKCKNYYETGIVPISLHFLITAFITYNTVCQDTVHYGYFITNFTLLVIAFYHKTLGLYILFMIALILVFLYSRVNFLIKMQACLLVCSERQGASLSNHFLCWAGNHLLGSRLLIGEGLPGDAFDWMFRWCYFQ